MPNELCHFEICATDEQRSRRFYSALFGWEFDASSMPGYTLIKPGEGPGGGMMKCMPGMPGPSLRVYFQVDDIQPVLKKAEQGGGRVIMPETPIPNVGAFAMISDPDGVCFGIFKPRAG